MKNNSKLNRIARLMPKLLIPMAILSLFLSACGQKQTQATPDQIYYTCSMHPHVHQDRPGNCPICGMKLIKVEIARATGNQTTNRIVLTAAQIQLAGIQTDTVKEQFTGNEKLLTGTVTADEKSTEALNARVGGRIQQLFIRTTGEKINVGQPVYSIYSEELQEAEKEFLLAIQQQKALNNPDVDYRQLRGAAENKLLLWGMSAQQIKNLAVANKVPINAVIYSKASGTVAEIAVHEGDYVNEGMPILKTQNLNSLWVEAQIYANESASYHENTAVRVSIPDLGINPINSKITFVNPDLMNGSKINLLRIAIPNTYGLLKPGMLAYVNTVTDKERLLAIPVTAVLTDAMGDKVWVKNHDGSFSGRRIQTGAGNQSFVGVISGLVAGDIVVTAGAYLLNSEAIFKNGDEKMTMKM